jgi:hypothetical protein
MLFNDLNAKYWSKLRIFLSLLSGYGYESPIYLNYNNAFNISYVPSIYITCFLLFLLKIIKILLSCDISIVPVFNNLVLPLY